MRISILLLVLIALIVSTSSCGVKGPPLPPLALVPQKTEDRTPAPRSSTFPSNSPASKASPSPHERNSQ